MFINESILANIFLWKCHWHVNSQNIYVQAVFGTFFQDVFEKIQHLSPRALVIDSIQTVYLKGVTGSAGGLPQV